MNARFFGPVNFFAASFSVDFTVSSISTATRIYESHNAILFTIINGTLFLSASLKGNNETGAVLEQSIQLTFNQSLTMTLRRIVVRLKHPTRDGDLEIAILSNLLLSDASAVKIAALYQKRWWVERLFQMLDQCLRGEINTLAYPRAASLVFVWL